MSARRLTFLVLILGIFTPLAGLARVWHVDRSASGANNGNAGAEILHYYLTRYAIPKKEDKQPGGHLARATYSAYNAGPGGLARYRGVRQSSTWKKVDDAFWNKFQAVSSGKEMAMAVKSCFRN